MRLIDADSLKQKFMSDAFREMVDDEPTAYDVEKVVTDVKKENKRALHVMYRLHGNNYPTQLMKNHNDVIDKIVRNGGKEKICH